jgi:hypothetical protein
MKMNLSGIHWTVTMSPIDTLQLPVLLVRIVRR